MRQSGGDVVKFLGDAVLILFPIDPNASYELRAATVLMASLCALKLVSECGKYDSGEGQNAVSLRLHCGVGCGLVHCMCMGVDDRWEFVVSGEPLSQIGVAICEASAEEVSLSTKAFEYVKDLLESKKKAESSTGVILTGKRATLKYNDTPSGGKKGWGVLKKSVDNARSLNRSTIDTPQKDDKWIALMKDIKKSKAMQSTADHDLPPPPTSNTPSEGNSSVTNSPIKASRSSSTSLLTQCNTPAPINNVSYDYGGEMSTTSFVRVSAKVRTPVIDEFGTATAAHNVPSNLNNNNNMKMNNNTNAPFPLDISSSTSASSLAAFKASLSQKTASMVLEDIGSEGSDTEKHTTIKSIGRAIKQRFAEHSTDPFPLLEMNFHVNVVRKYLSRFLDDEDYMISTPDAKSSSKSLDDEDHMGCVEEDGKSSASPISRVGLTKAQFSTVFKLFVHDAARTALESSGAAYLFELRNVTTLFVELLGLDSDLSDGQVERPQKAMAVCLECLKRFGGSLRQYTVDDKGCVLIGAFGLPGSSHEDNSRRAVEAAVSIRQGLEAAGIGSKAGIAEGRVFCGLVGSGDRCEYAMMGASVNLAARLMGKCQPGDILVSETVYLSSQTAFVYTALPRMQAKGYSYAVAVYRPTERTQSNLLLGSNTPGEVGFVGRQEEINMISSALRDSRESDYPSFFIIDGPPSVGKTRLAAEAFRVASESSQHPIRVAAGTASAAHISSPYYVIRQILDQVMDLKSNKSDSDLLPPNPSANTRLKVSDFEANDELEHGIRVWISTHIGNNIIDLKSLIRPREGLPPITDSLTKDFIFTFIELKLLPGQDVNTDEITFQDLIPLLCEIFNKNFEENETTAMFTKEVRHVMLDFLLIKIFLVALSSSLDAILVDNLQWCDWASLRMFVRLVRRMPRGVFIGTTRSVEEINRNLAAGSTAERQRRQMAIMTLIAMSTYIQPPPLNASEIQIIIEKTLGARLLLAYPSVLSSSNIELIMNRAGGSPFHASVLAAGLKNALMAGKYTSVQDLPAGADNLTISRFDQLSKPDQAVIKTASVVGLYFAESALIQALSELGMLSDRISFEQTLQRLLDSNLIYKDFEQNVYKFADRSVQESIYNLMLETQRERVHGIIGMYFESLYGVDNVEKFEEIAYHYSLSDITDKKIEYLQKSGEISKINHLYDVVYRNYGKLVKLGTGYSTEELLKHCLSHDQTSSSSVWSFICIVKETATFALHRGNSNAGNQNLDSYPGNNLKRWLSISDFKLRVFPSAEANIDNIISQDMLNHWVAEMGRAQFL